MCYTDVFLYMQMCPEAAKFRIAPLQDEEYFYATQLFILQEYRDVFICLEEDATSEQRIEWLRMTWEQLHLLLIMSCDHCARGLLKV